MFSKRNKIKRSIYLQFLLIKILLCKMILVTLIKKDLERSNSKYYHYEQCQYNTNHGWEFQ